jgi:sigma-B regulation protein RsbU (phosphoserine phosphatase)
VPHLCLSPPEGPVEVLPLRHERLVIGRSRECDLILPDVLLSRHHAEIARTADGWAVRDLGSRNGTRVNGERIAGERSLADGDTVVVAGWQLLFREGEPAEDHSTSSDHRSRVEDITALVTRSGLDPGDFGRQSKMLGTLTRAAADLVASSTADEILDTLLSHLLDALPATRGAVALLGEGPPVPSVVAVRGTVEGPSMTIDPFVAERVLSGRTALLAPRVPREDESVRSVLCAPLWFSGPAEGTDRVVGLVALESDSEPCPFQSEHVGLVSAVVNLAASRLESVRLRQETAEKHRLEEDLRGAARIQESLLPEGKPVLDGWEVAGSSRLCSAVGADYYDFAVDRGALLLALGDVAGKGLAAALCMAALRAAVRALWTDEDPLPRLVSRINENLCQTLPPNRFATLFLGRLQPGSGELLFINAGHASPVLVPRAGGLARLEEGGTILGAFPAGEWGAGHAVLAPGDVLVLLSDGVMEAQGPELAPETVAAVVRREDQAGAEAIASALQRTADAVLGPTGIDDRTFLVLRRLPG